MDTSAEHAAHLAIMDHVDRLNNQITGNGQPGLLTRVARLEVKVQAMLWAGAFVAGAAIGPLVQEIIDALR